VPEPWGKMMMIHFLVIRERLVGSILAYPNDQSNIIVRICKPILGVGAPLCKDSVQLLERLEKNCTENEPFFLLTCFALSATGAVPENATTVIAAFTYSRIAHSIFHAFGRTISFNGALRSSTYFVGLLCNVYLGYMAITA
jgi:uncharacterized MAPEG superfamily protein